MWPHLMIDFLNAFLVVNPANILSKIPISHCTYISKYFGALWYTKKNGQWRWSKPQHNQTRWWTRDMCNCHTVGFPTSRNAHFSFEMNCDKLQVTQWFRGCSTKEVKNVQNFTPFRPPWLQWWHLKIQNIVETLSKNLLFW